MRRHDLDVCLLSNEPTSATRPGPPRCRSTMSTFARCVLVPQEGTPILFEHANSMHRSALRTPDVRPMHAWEFYDDPSVQAETWADVTLDAMAELGVPDGVIGVDRLGAPAYLALRDRGEIRDGSRDAGGASRQDRAGARASGRERDARHGDAGRVRARDRARGERARAPGRPHRRDDPGRWRVPRHDHRLQRPEHEPVARGGDRPPSRGRRPRVRRHRHRRDRGASSACPVRSRWEPGRCREPCATTTEPRSSGSRG